MHPLLFQETQPCAQVGVVIEFNSFLLLMSTSVSHAVPGSFMLFFSVPVHSPSHTCPPESPMRFLVQFVHIILSYSHRHRSTSVSHAVAGSFSGLKYIISWLGFLWLSRLHVASLPLSNRLVIKLFCEDLMVGLFPSFSLLHVTSVLLCWV